MTLHFGRSRALFWYDRVERVMCMEIEQNVMVDAIKKRYKESFIGCLLLGILAVVLLLNPDNFMVSMIQVFGYISIFLGVLSIVYYFRLGKTEQMLSRNLQNGIVLCVFGCITFMQTIMIKDMLTFLLGGYLVFQGASRVQMSLYLRENLTKLYVWLLSLSLLYVLIGFLVIVNPFERMIKMPLFLAISLLISQIIVVMQNLIVLFSLKEKKGE